MTETIMAIPFDYERALEVARRLAQLADGWEAAFERRRIGLERALRSWTGPNAERAAAHLLVEIDGSAEVCRRLRSEADRWARAWADAVDDQHRIDWRLTAGDDASGGVVAPPPPVATPTAPGYHPTAPTPYRSIGFGS